MRYIILTLILALATSAVLMAQSQTVFSEFGNREKIGDNYYDNLAFEDAVDAYKDAWHAKPGGAVSLKLANAYRKLNMPAEAVLWYDIALDDTLQADVKNKLYYAQALSSNADYAEAKKFYKAYADLEKDDSRAVSNIVSIESQDRLYRNVSSVKVTAANFNSEEADFGPSFYDGHLVFVSSRKSGRFIKQTFAWDRSEFLDLYIVIDGEVYVIDRNLNSRYHEGPAAFYDGGSKMILTRNHLEKGKSKKSSDGLVKLQLYTAEKIDSSEFWSKPQPLSINNEEYSMGHPTLNATGTVLYFASDMPGGRGGADLYMSELKDGEWQQPVSLGTEINTEGDELFPHIGPDGMLYFASNGHGGLGGLDLFSSVLNGPKAVQINNLGAAMNSQRDDFGILMKADGQSGYFSSNRSGGMGSDDIYEFISDRPFGESYTVTGTVTENLEGEVISGRTIILKNNDGTETASTTSDSKGDYSFALEQDQIYALAIAADSTYFGVLETFNTLDSGEKTDWNVNLSLSKKQGFYLSGKVLDAQSGAPLEAVGIILIDNFSGTEVLRETIDARGFAHPVKNQKLNERISYQLKLEKKGYLGKVLTVNTELMEAGAIDLNEMLDLNLEKLEVGSDIGKIANIQPIYFDVGKAEIKAKAATELDKIVAIMNENPKLQIELGSHTDARGSAAGNMRLSDKRAKASADYIVSQGIGSERITGAGYGESQISNECVDDVNCSEAQHEANRRTEFKVVGF